jgi:ribosomal protein S27AE
MPKQVIRLLIAFVIFVSLFLLARYLLVPKSFYKLGHYRADAIDDIKNLEAKYSDSLTCRKCHKTEDSIKMGGVHHGINCQTCHGPGYKHVIDPKKNPLTKHTDREFCGKCHNENAARPAFIKQVNLLKHNTKSKCIVCHNPHSPGFKLILPKTDSTKKSGSGTQIDDATCGKCHNAEYTKKQSGVHKVNNCVMCHGAGDKHINDPAANKLLKPKGRAFCGQCHGTGSTTSGIKQIDLKVHNPDGDCTDCHNPHSPMDF